jgi:tyrosyl-tRNA synthetase
MSDPSLVLDELKARGLFHQCTGEEALRRHLRRPRMLYCGFDPTADSLTIGNLVPIMMLRVFARHGHQPVALLGGATGRIGDPSGKDEERRLLTEEQLGANLAAQRPIFEHFLGKDTRFVDNDDWFRGMTVYRFLRDVGKFFSVNQMLARDSVRSRLEREEQGISYTEFSYMLLQAYDFLHLFREDGVTLQVAGADQWGNLVSGVDLIRRTEGLDEHGENRAFALTAPLITRADGGKFGKTEAGAVWLSHRRPSGEPGTSPYGYYQFWLNASDADVRRFLLLFTDRTPEATDELVTRHEEAPHRREAQRTLAREATAMLHGEEAMERSEKAAGALFSGNVRELDLETLEEAFASAPSSRHEAEQLVGDGARLTDVLAETPLATSKSEARRQLQAGAISVNGERVDDPYATLSRDDLLHGAVILLRRGKKVWHVTRWG